VDLDIHDFHDHPFRFPEPPERVPCRNGSPTAVQYLRSQYRPSEGSLPDEGRALGSRERDLVDAQLARPLLLGERQAEVVEDAAVDPSEGVERDFELRPIRAPDST
jgi:hypothetical protein